jgi:nitrate reductase NapD
MMRLDPEAHIASLLVHVRPEAEAAVRATLAADPAIEVAGARDGKLVLVVEAAHERALVQRIDALHALPGVLGAVLVYHQVERAGALDEELPCE